MLRYLVAALGAALLAGSAHAMDENACASGMVCASKPETVAKALQDAGYKAALGLDEEGDPMIESAASGYDYTIYFYGCEVGIQCDSIQFIVSFEKDETNTPVLANLWNRNKRFIQLSATEGQTLNARYDVSTMAGVNAANFADVIDWWATMLGELSRFFAEHPDGK